jgi:hypothetical protein
MSAGLITAGIVGLVWLNARRRESFGAEVEIVDDRQDFWKY